MTREIKFRAWKKDTKEMYDIKYLCCDNIPDNNEEVMQFTGLKDKNGKEIYEGDILRYDFELAEYDDIAVVEMRDCGGYTKMIKNKGKIEFGDWFKDIDMRQHEVIGNIYENPELLEEKE